MGATLLQIILVLSMLGGAVYWVGGVYSDHVLAKQKAVTEAAEKKRGTDIGAWIDHARAEADAGDARVAAKQTEIDALQTDLNKWRQKNVTKFAINSCTVTAGLVRQHNAAATGRAPVDLFASAGQSVDAPAGIGIDQYSAAVENNYSTCRKWINRANEWQHHAAESCRAWNEKWHRNDPCPPYPGGDRGESQGVGAEKKK